MSELEKSEKDSESPCCSKSLQNVLSDGDVPIIIDTINNKDGIVNIGLVNFLPKTDTEQKSKLMFQVKNPVHTFTGREEFLQELHDTVQKCKQEGSRVSIISQTSSISGLGGIGKTETVRMYIHKFSHEYDSVVWIDAENPSDAIYQFTTLAYNKLRINVKDHKGNPREFSHILEDVYRKLCQKPKQLLIVFDNAEALDDTDTHALGIRKLLPAQTITNEPPTVLITSRQQFWEDINVITLGLWKMEECIEFIYKRLHLRDSPENKKDATELAELFDRLPIALEVAVSVIAEQLRKRKVGGSGVYSINSLIAEYKAGDRKMLSKKTQQNSTQVTMQLLLNVSLNKIRKYEEGELAIKILALMAYLSPTGIPKKMIHALMHETHEDELANALTLLTDYSIIRSDSNDFTIHRVFQDVVITILPTLSLQLQTISANPECVEDTDADEIKVLNELTRELLNYTSELHQTHEDYNAVITNVVHTTDYIIQKSVISNFYTFMENTAQFIRKTHFKASIRFYRELVKFDKSKTEKSDDRICANLEIISEIYFENKLYEKELESYNEQLTQRLNARTNTKQEDESKKKEVLRIQYNMEYCLSTLGKHEEALELNYILEKDFEEVHGPLHPHTIITRMKIADELRDRGKIDEALKYYYIVEKDQEKAIGPFHRGTLKARVDIANSLFAQGKIEDALELYYTVESGREKVLGPLHPETLEIKLNIVKCISKLGKEEEALKLYYALQECHIQALGPLHFNSLVIKRNIANSLSGLGKKKEALELYLAVLHDQENSYGPLDADTLATKSNIAVCMRDVGNCEEALIKFNTDQGEYEQFFGFGHLHPNTLITKMNIANCLSDIGNNEEALMLYDAVENEMEKTLSPLHPHILLTKMNKAILLCDQGKTQESLKLFAFVLEEQVNLHGLLFPYSLVTKMNTIVCLTVNNLGKKLDVDTLKHYYEVEEQQERVLGPEHPFTLATKRNISNHLTISDEGKKGEFLRLYYVKYLCKA